MRSYEVTFIVDSILSGDEIKSAAQTYVDMLQNEGCKIVNVDEMGLRQLAYPIKKRSTGIYYCIEFQCDQPDLIGKLELAFRRDERIIRFLSVALDKYGVKYNQDKREGKIGKTQAKKDAVVKEIKAEKAVASKTQPKTEKAPAPAPAATAAVKEEE